MRIERVLARVPVTDLEAALPLYQRLAGTDEVQRFTWRAISLARVGPFLLLAGPPAELAAVHRVASLVVDDVPQAAAAVLDAGGELLEGPAAGPNGTRAIARHPDGAVFEYLQLDR